MPSERDHNRDDFWEIDRLLPQKKKLPPLKSDTTPVEITVEAQSAPSPQNQAQKLTFPRPAEKNRLIPELEYEVENSLIAKVKIEKWSSPYSFYESFRADAVRLFDAKVPGAEYVSFFSYTPQYKQLNRAQLEWYLWWRENARRGVYLQSDYSYLLLYIYEIINLPDLIEPAEGLRLLCDLWLAYRGTFHRIDKYLAEWVCDFCLIHRLSLPKERLDPIIPEIIDFCSLKEFYMHFDEPASNTYARLLIQYASNYHWKSSKYVTEENLPLFEKHIVGAVAYLLAHDKENSALASARSDTLSRLARDAFSGSLCAHNIKRRIEVYYYSFNRSYSLRLAVTSLVKYAENRLRARLDIKSRLAVSGLSADIKKRIDQYFEHHLPLKKPAPPEEPIYLKAYETVHTGLSPERALDIEARSWETTQLLVSAFDEAAAPLPPPAEAAKAHKPAPDFDRRAAEPSGSPPTPNFSPAPASFPPPGTASFPPLGGASPYRALLAALDPLCAEFLRRVALGAPGEAEQLAKAHRQLPEKLADTINELAFDLCGDILLEEDGGYSVIADYYEELKACLNPN